MTYKLHDKGHTQLCQIILDLLEYSRVGRVAHKVTAVNLEHLVSEVLSLKKKYVEEIILFMYFNYLFC